jgi:hypothetical protein
MTATAVSAFQAQCDETPGSEYLFPTPAGNASKPYITTLKKAWRATLQKAGVPSFPSLRTAAYIRDPPRSTGRAVRDGYGREETMNQKGLVGRRGRTRTGDPLLRRQMLYPPELRAHIGSSTDSKPLPIL